MIDAKTFSIFFLAALTLAVMPGPGMLYVLARTLRGGKREGILSTLGTGLGGLVHTIAAALGISALLSTSALAFSLVKWLGALYLIYLGIRTLIERQHGGQTPTAPVKNSAFRQGIVTEVLNPKTAIFFLAFIPQFVTPNANVFFQFVLLGSISTLLNSSSDLLVALTAGPLSNLLKRNKRLEHAQRYVSGGTLIGLGLYVIAEK